MPGTGLEPASKRATNACSVHRAARALHLSMERAHGAAGLRPHLGWPEILSRFHTLGRDDGPQAQAHERERAGAGDLERDIDARCWYHLRREPRSESPGRGRSI